MGEVELSQILSLWAFHDLSHIRQVADIIHAAGVGASGAGVCEASLRMDMLPPQEEGAELLGRGHLRRAPSRHCRPLAQLIVHGDVAVLDARSAGKESPCRFAQVFEPGVPPEPFPFVPATCMHE